MKQKIGLFLCLALLLTGCSYQTKTIRFGAADIGGMYYTVANAYAGLASKESSDLKFEVKNTAGSAANLRLLSGNYIDLGIAQADLVRAAHEGTGSFSDNRQQGYRAIAGLYTEACQIVVRADSDIRTLNDLQGKTVSIGASESGTEQNATEILKLSGLTSKLVHMVNLDYADAAGKLASGEIDALFCTAGIRTAVIEELAKECDLRLLSIDDTCLEKLLATTKEYSKCHSCKHLQWTGRRRDNHWSQSCTACLRCPFRKNRGKTYRNSVFPRTGSGLCHIFRRCF